MKFATVEAMAFRGESAAEVIDIAMISTWKENPRRTINPEGLRELADSIGKVGVLQPILVRPDGTKFSIVSGERRYRAAKLAGLTTIPAVVRTLSDAEALEIAVTENLQREDVPPLEEAEGYERLHLTHAYTVEEIADKVGKSKTYVYSRLKLTALCEEAREFLRKGELTPTVALLVARIPTPSEQVEAAKACVADWQGTPLSATRAHALINSRYMRRLHNVEWDPTDATLCPAAGACTDCPKRTGNQPELFGDIKEQDTCIDQTCFGGKQAAHFARQLDAHRASGGRVFETKEEAAKFFEHTSFVYADDLCPHDNGQRTWREVLALSKAPPRSIIVSGWRINGMRDEVYVRAEAMAVLAELGMVDEEEAKQAEADDEDDDDSTTRSVLTKEERETNREQAGRLIVAILKSGPRTPTLIELRELASFAFDPFDPREEVIDAAFGMASSDTDDEDEAREDDAGAVQTIVETTTNTALLQRLIVAGTLQSLSVDNLQAVAREIGLNPEQILADREAAGPEPEPAPAPKKKRAKKAKAATTEEAQS